MADHSSGEAHAASRASQASWTPRRDLRRSGDVGPLPQRVRVRLVRWKNEAAIREALTALRTEGQAISKAAVARRTGISDRSLRKRYAHLFAPDAGPGDTRNFGVIRAPGTSMHSVFRGSAAVGDCGELRGNRA